MLSVLYFWFGLGLCLVTGGLGVVDVALASCTTGIFNVTEFRRSESPVGDRIKLTENSITDR